MKYQPGLFKRIQFTYNTLIGQANWMSQSMNSLDALRDSIQVIRECLDKLEQEINYQQEEESVSDNSNSN